MAKGEKAQRIYAMEEARHWNLGRRQMKPRVQLGYDSRADEVRGLLKFLVEITLKPKLSSKCLDNVFYLLIIVGWGERRTDQIPCRKKQLIIRDSQTSGPRPENCPRFYWRTADSFDKHFVQCYHIPEMTWAVSTYS